MLEHYDANHGELSAPILEPGITWALAHSERIEHVVLFASDQPQATTLDRHWNTDTIAFGRILQRLLSEKFGQRIGRVECCPMPCNPADYDETRDFFANQLPRRVPPAQFDVVWIAPVGGAPASNTGLLLNAVRIYRERSQIIYVPEQGQVQVLDLHREILAGYAREQVKAHLDKRDFATLRDMIARSAPHRPWLPDLCNYADCRMRFDFAGAEAALDAAAPAAGGGQARARIERCQRSLSALRDQALQPSSASSEADWERWFALQRACLAELYFNLRLKAQRGEWVDFLGRLFRLDEAALRFVFERATRHSSEKAGQTFVDFVAAIEADPDVVAKLKEKDLEWREPNTRNLHLWLEVQVRRDGRAFGPLREPFRKIEGLRELRNKSILAHGYQGVSREAIGAALKQSVESFVDGPLRDLLAHLGAAVATDDDPLVDVVRWLEEEV